MKKVYSALSVFAATAFATVSCVDPAYNLDNLNTEVNIPPVEIPVGSVNKLTLGDILQLEGNDGVIRVRENGDYYLYFEGEPLVQEIELNVKHIDGVSVEESPFYATAPSALALGTDFGVCSGIPVETRFDVKVTSEDFPTEVTKVFRVDGEGNIVLTLAYESDKVPFSRATFRNLEITFPEWVEFASVSPEGMAFSGNKVTADALVLEADKPTEIVCDVKGINFEKVPEGQGIVDDGEDEEGKPKRKLVVDDEVVLTAALSLSASDCTVGSGSFRTGTFSKSLEIGEITINSVRAGFDVKRVVEGTTVEIKDIPEQLRSTDTRIDPYELRLFFNLQNDFPVGASLYTGITALSGEDDSEQTQRFLAVGTADDPILIAGGGKTDFCFYLREPSGREGYSERQIPNLGDFLYPIPEKLLVDEITVSAKADDVVIPIEDKYAVTVNYLIDAPLAFGENMSVDIDYDLGNLKVDLGDNVSFTEAQVFFDVVNSLPISFGLTAEVIDADGVLIPGIKAVLVGAGQNGQAPVQAGSIASPTSSRMELQLSVDEGQTINFNGVRLNLVAGDPKVGAVLNKDMGLEIKNASVKLSSGVTINAGGLAGGK